MSKYADRRSAVCSRSPDSSPASITASAVGGNAAGYLCITDVMGRPRIASSAISAAACARMRFPVRLARVDIPSATPIPADISALSEEKNSARCLLLTG